MATKSKVKVLSVGEDLGEATHWEMSTKSKVKVLSFGEDLGEATNANVLKKHNENLLGNILFIH